MQKALHSYLDIEILDHEVSKIPKKDKRYMLYAHVPFCHVFCPYCSFHKYHYQSDLCKEYFKNLRIEMKRVKEAGYTFSSLYVGGGTPLIDEDELIKTLELAKKLFDIDEISCETDPNHIKPEKLYRFKGLIDRLSVGVQSFDNDILRKISRLDKFGDQKELIRKLSDAVGILPILSLDLIFNFPFQTKKELLTDINIAKKLSSEQITLYPLMHSEITSENIAKTLGVSQKDNEYEFYKIIKNELKEYYPNNSWSFSKVKTNLTDEYVGSNHEYVGIGSGAFSFLDGKLLINAFNLNDYNLRIKNGKSTVMATCDFKPKERLEYLLLTELFDGVINIKEFNTANDANIKKDLALELNLLRLVGAVYEKNGEIKTTKFGSYLCLVLMKEFYTGMDKVRAIFKDNTGLKGRIKVMSEKTRIAI
ncbi:MAG: coproporphyrinogen III oxidase family protein [Campylobacter sp.]|nr:coproporphyrinogen III oxidase family protein [Campylobacter sp.]